MCTSVDRPQFGDLDAPTLNTPATSHTKKRGSHTCSNGTSAHFPLSGSSNQMPSSCKCRRNSLLSRYSSAENPLLPPFPGRQQRKCSTSRGCFPNSQRRTTTWNFLQQWKKFRNITTAFRIRLFTFTSVVHYPESPGVPRSPPPRSPPPESTGVVRWSQPFVGEWHERLTSRSPHSLSVKKAMKARKDWCTNERWAKPKNKELTF